MRVRFIAMFQEMCAVSMIFFVFRAIVIFVIFSKIRKPPKPPQTQGFGFATNNNSLKHASEHIMPKFSFDERWLATEDGDTLVFSKAVCITYSYTPLHPLTTNYTAESRCSRCLHMACTKSGFLSLTSMYSI